MAGKLPTRTTKPTNGPRPIDARKSVGGGLKSLPSPFRGASPPNTPGGGAGIKGTPSEGYKPTPTPINPGRARASGMKPVGYGLKGEAFYDIEAYHQSKAYAIQQKQGRAPVTPTAPPPPQQPRGMGNRLGGVSPSFPHAGAPAAGGTMDEHMEAAREAMLRATEGGMR